jgi:hypothetical protein
MSDSVILGETASHDTVIVQVDASGHLQVDVITAPAIVVSGTVNVLALPSIPAGSNNIGDVDVLTLPSIPAGTNRVGSAGIEGYYSGAWHKAPLPFGPSDVHASTVSNLALAAGQSNQDFPALTGNAFTVIKHVVVRYTGTIGAGTYLILGRVLAATFYPIKEFRALTSGVYSDWVGDIVLGPAETLRVIVLGATAGDDFVGYSHGYYMTRNL